MDGQEDNRGIRNYTFLLQSRSLFYSKWIYALYDFAFESVSVTERKKVDQPLSSKRREEGTQDKALIGIFAS